MWSLKNIQGQNVCAFKSFEYTPTQNVATLVFGENLEDDSQDSNGSGKSAIIEAIAIGLLGTPLRKAKMEEIINDAENTATITLTLENPVLSQTLEINRILDRKADQKVSIKLNGEDVVMANVTEYNRYVLEAVGLTRDQILTTFILCAYHFHSFLDAPDKEKKEIINRFSNGSIVDQSIEAVRVDLEEAKKGLVEAEKECAVRKTRVETLQKEIDEFDGSHEYRENRKKEMIAAHKESIANINGTIRAHNANINKFNDALNALDDAGDELEALENSHKDIGDLQDSIREVLDKHSVKLISNRYFDRYLSAGQQLADYEKKLEALHKKMDAVSTETHKAEAEFQAASRDFEVAKASHKDAVGAIEAKRVQLKEQIRGLHHKKVLFEKDIDRVQQAIRNCRNLLASSITCPACKHKFILNIDKSVKAINTEMSEYESTAKKHAENLEVLQITLDATNKELTATDREIYHVNAELYEQQGKARQAEIRFENAKEELGQCNHSEARYKQAMDSANKTLIETRTEMFNEAFSNIDDRADEIQKSIDGWYKEIDIRKSQIKTYEDAIVKLENTDENVNVAEMKKKLEVYKNDVIEADRTLAVIKANVEALTTQEMRFLNFKTYLANKKIEALSQETNNFLDHIGSSLRIRFSGYTVLKTGKIRDKISVSMTRNGVDCGSFGKLSVGERSRGILANVLAMHKLCNANCPDGRGLNFLILDEILDSTDETGISRTADVLSDLGLTSIIITHIPVADSYPHRLVVRKQHGVSTISQQ